MTTRPFGYGSLVSQSLRIAWLLKPLWLLGVFVSTSSWGSGYRFENPWRDWVNLERSIGELQLLLMMMLLVFGLLAAILFFILHVIAQGGLIHAGAQAAAGQRPTLAESWRRGLSRFWPVLGISVIGFLASSLSGTFAIGAPILIGIIVHPLIGVLIGLFTVTMLVGFAIFFVPAWSYALRASVLDDLGVVEAWSMAYRMIRRAPARAAGVSAVRVMYIAVIAMTLVMLTFIFAAPGVALGLLWPPVLIGFIVLVASPIALVVFGYLGSAGSYYWTLAFLWTRESQRLADA